VSLGHVTVSHCNVNWLLFFPATELDTQKLVSSVPMDTHTWKPRKPHEIKASFTGQLELDEDSTCSLLFCIHWVRKLGFWLAAGGLGTVAGEARGLPLVCESKMKKK